MFGRSLLVGQEPLKVGQVFPDGASRVLSELLLGRVNQSLTPLDGLALQVGGYLPGGIQVAATYRFLPPLAVVVKVLDDVASRFQDDAQPVRG